MPSQLTGNKVPSHADVARAVLIAPADVARAMLIAAADVVRAVPIMAADVARAVQNEYPDKWPTFWKDLLGMLPEGPGVVDMFCRILTAIDDDVISLDISRCAA